ncbi:MAG: zinc-binding metallopeptidase family protein [Propionibacteriaceae bacterium]
MQAFSCRVCAVPLHFENSRCGRCGTATRYHRATTTLVPFATDRYVDAKGLIWTSCANLGVVGCNWLAPVWNWGVPALCTCCALTRTRPADDDVAGMRALRVAEFAKRRLVYSLDRLGLPIDSGDRGGDTGLVFDLLSSARQAVVTGHHNGVITVDLAESDDAHRASLRVQMAEPYRTVLGHFRHEIGHYYWARLVGGTDHVAGFRARFGDERISYDEAMARHYGGSEGGGAGLDDRWQERYVSQYASMHPWEDFAEVFAHFLHITDTMQTARAYGVATEGVRPGERFARLVSRVWVPLTVGLNQINRSMGNDDLYPFVLTSTVIDKLCWMAELVGWEET